MKFSFRIFLAAMVLCCSAYAREFIEVNNVAGNNVSYKIYAEKNIKVATFPNLIIHESASNKRSSIYRSFYDTLDELQAALLREGLAKLKDPNAASSNLRALESQAREVRVGLWAEEGERHSSAEPTPTNDGGSKEEEPLIDWDKIVAWAIPIGKGAMSIGAIIISLGLVTGIISLLVKLVKYFYRRSFIERNVELIIIGRLSAGKTAVMKRLVDPSVTPEIIANLSPSTSIVMSKREKYIPMGKYEVYPVVTDVPGSKPGAFLDYIMGRGIKILLVVLAPTKMNISKDEYVVDNNFVQSQMGYVEALVEGTLQSRRISKPDLVIVFINKFDLWSKHPPYDSAALNILDDFQRVFSDHTNGIFTQAKLSKVQAYVVVGSALQGWGTDRVLHLIQEALHA